VHGGSGISLGLIEALRAMRPKAPFLELVHRIDRDTSGCIMIAKRRSILIHLHDALKAGTIKKRYLALVAGQWRGGKVIEAPLFKYVLRSGERMVRVDPTGKQSQTNIKTLESFPGATLIEASPVTGRTHQIRVHCQFMGHPIVGDQKYGELEFNRQAKIKGLDRLFLHAHQLVIKLPYDPFDLTITCPLPETCETYLAQLRA
jgi:23S rRNA pseudouridine955/2504/2580 synthase